MKQTKEKSRCPHGHKDLDACLKCIHPPVAMKCPHRRKKASNCVDCAIKLGLIKMAPTAKALKAGYSRKDWYRPDNWWKRISCRSAHFLLTEINIGVDVFQSKIHIDILDNEHLLLSWDDGELLARSTGEGIMWFEHLGRRI